jgi:hypothetical protein
MVQREIVVNLGGSLVLIIQPKKILNSPHFYIALYGLPKKKIQISAHTFLGSIYDAFNKIRHILDSI